MRPCRCYNFINGLCFINGYFILILGYSNVHISSNERQTSLLLRKIYMINFHYYIKTKRYPVTYKFDCFMQNSRFNFKIEV